MPHSAVSPASRILLDDEAMSRTLSRVAHEIIERNDDLDAVALAGYLLAILRLPRRFFRAPAA